MRETITPEEGIVFALRKLYAKYGYMPFKMSKFEEYDTYVKNKAFLASDNVITFTDTNGKLKALKPDVTLSIVKNTKDTAGGVQKTYYDENVYRVAGDSKAFKELLQVGVECIGDIDDYCVSEVLSLAAESLKILSDEYVLDVSHLGIVGVLVDESGLSDGGKKKLTKALKEKNAHGAEEIFTEEGIEEEKYAPILRLVKTAGSPEEVLPVIRALLGGKGEDKVQQLEDVTAFLPKGSVRIDFSVVNDMRYYNGIVFQGFIKGVPGAVLSGGQYDLLLKKMRKNARAIGFALRPERPRTAQTGEDYDVDVVVLYNECVPFGVVRAAVEKAIAGGESATAQKVLPEKLRCRRVVDLTKGGANA